MSLRCGRGRRCSQTTPVIAAPSGGLMSTTASPRRSNTMPSGLWVNSKRVKKLRAASHLLISLKRRRRRKKRKETNVIRQPITAEPRQQGNVFMSATFLGGWKLICRRRNSAKKKIKSYQKVYFIYLIYFNEVLMIPEQHTIQWLARYCGSLKTAGRQPLRFTECTILLKVKGRAYPTCFLWCFFMTPRISEIWLRSFDAVMKVNFYTDP